METICQACGYQRKPTDQAPDWECPACGKAYAKTSHDLPGPAVRYAQSCPSESGNPLVKAVAYEASPDGVTIIICLGGACLIAIPAMFLINESSRFQWPLTAVMLLMPWIAVAVAYARRDSLLDELGGYTCFFLCFSLCFLMFGVVGVAANNSLAFEAEKVWPMGIPLAIPFGLACAAVARRLNKEKVQQCPLVVWSVLAVVAYAYGGAPVVLANRWLDHSSPAVHETTVIRKDVERSGRGGIVYVVTLTPWESIPNSNSLIVSRSEYVAMEPGRSVVCMAAHPGAFDLAWGQRVSCAGQASVDEQKP